MHTLVFLIADFISVYSEYILSLWHASKTTNLILKYSLPFIFGKYNEDKRNLESA